MSEMTSILPHNRSPLEAAMDLAIRQARPDLAMVGALMSAEECPADLLPWLAWAWSVDDWSADWPEATKRAVVAAAPEVHRRKGTVGSVRRALTAEGYGDVVILEQATSPALDRGLVLGDDAAATRADGVVLHDLTHWAHYAVIVKDPITRADADRIARRLAQVAPARCRLVSVSSDVLIELDPAYALDVGWALNSTYETEAA